MVGTRLFGYDQGITGGLLDLPSFVKYFPEINPTETGISSAESSQRSTNQGIAVASYNLGCFVGAVLTIFIGNPLGRRRTIMVGCCIMATGATLQASAYSLPHWIVGRIITGIGNGINTSTVPTWQSESAKSHARGKLVMIEGALITGGICMAYWINYGEFHSAKFYAFAARAFTYHVCAQASRGLAIEKLPGDFPWPSKSSSLSSYSSLS